MEQYIKKSAIKAEIKRELESIVNATNDHAIGRRFELGNLEIFLDSFEEPTNEDLEKAAYKASLNNFVDPECLDDDELRNFDWIKYYEQVFKTGALWQKRQDSIDAKAVNLDKEFDSFLNDIEGVPPMWHSEEQIEWGKDIARHFFELGLAQQNDKQNE